MPSTVNLKNLECEAYDLCGKMATFWLLPTGWPCYRGRLKFHALRAVMTNTPNIAFAFLKQLFSFINNQKVDIAYTNNIFIENTT